MSIHSKHNGARVELSPRVKHNGVIKVPLTGWTKKDGALVKIWESAVPFAQVFTATQAITVPKGATAALISGCGAGSASYAGASVLNWYTPVTEEESILCTIGSTGATGGATSFGNLITLGGGTGSAAGTVDVCRSFSSGAETPFGKSNASGYGAAGRNGILIVKWIMPKTGTVLTESQNFAVPEGVNGVLVSGCGGGGSASVDMAWGASRGGAGGSVISHYVPVTAGNGIQCTVGYGRWSWSETGGDTSLVRDTKFGDSVTLAGGENAPSWDTKGEDGAVHCGVNFSDSGSTPWGKMKSGGCNPEDESVGYGISGTPNPYNFTLGRPGLLILEHVNNKDTIVLTASQTISVPSGVTGALISGCGAGGGAVSLTRAPSKDSLYGGGAGGSVINYYVPLTAGESIECVIGAVNYANGSGGDTKFGSHLTLGGGGACGIMVTGATGSAPTGVNLSQDAATLSGGYTPFGSPSHSIYTSGVGMTYYDAVGYGAGAEGSETGMASTSLPGLLIIQWVRS